MMPTLGARTTWRRWNMAIYDAHFGGSYNMEEMEYGYILMPTLGARTTWRRWNMAIYDAHFGGSYNMEEMEYGSPQKYFAADTELRLGLAT